MARVVVDGVNANEEETPFRKDSIPGAVIGDGFAHVHLLGRARSEWAPALLRDAVLAHGAREQIPDHLRAVVGRVDVVDLDIVGDVPFEGWADVDEDALGTAHAPGAW